MSFRSGERRDGSNYAYPLVPTVAPYQGVPLDVVRIDANKGVYLEMLRERLKDLEQKQENAKAIIDKINASIATLNAEENGQEIAELNRARMMFENDMAENKKQSDFIREEINKVQIQIVEQEEPQEDVF